MKVGSNHLKEEAREDQEEHGGAQRLVADAQQSHRDTSTGRHKEQPPAADYGSLSSRLALHVLLGFMAFSISIDKSSNMW